ncbi:aminotransferase class III-fold pyridoxal phosphate-dependent enzyme [Amycolatopsis anabasis]|uniref:aminotransferase class III-fold pyridoxal phosphate-dependent enzyme n=1 Tax=Amycolatopsis anabasis TaxID=1840409 RepID=UPI00131BC9D6|nr:aminotransferase class III-fold pyridoxal phosphate-dependent enzyme [Amycolatopsis anabasis]
MTNTEAQYRRITAGSPALTDDRVRDLLRTRFGVDAVRTAALAGETDQNVWLSDDRGGEYVLKLCAESERARVEFQTGLLRHLERSHPELPVPRVRTGSTGGAIVPVPGPDGVVARLLSWVPGTPLAEVPRYSTELLRDVGAAAGRLTAATGSWRPPTPPESHYWDFLRADAVLGGAPEAVGDPELRAALARIRAEFVPSLSRFTTLPTAVVHHDLNAYNVLVDTRSPRHRVSGFIDFGDALHSARVADLAILASSVLRGAEDPLRVAAVLAAAYHGACPLSEAELDLVFPLIALRTAMVAATTARLGAAGAHGDPRHRSPATAELARKLAAIPAAVGTGMIRHACGLAASPHAAAVTGWLDAPERTAESFVDGELAVVDLGAGSAVFDGVDPGDPGALTAAARAAIAAERPAVALGRFGEPRFPESATGGSEPANVHIGLEFFAAPGAPVSAPLAGRVEAAGLADLVLRHEPAPGVRFWTVYSGLEVEAEPDAEIGAGERIGRIADRSGAGPAPGLRVRLATVPVTGWPEVPAHVTRTEFPAWRSLFPDPGRLFGPDSPVTAWTPSVHAALRGRETHLPRTHPTYFEQPMAMVRARDCRFYDEWGRSYLDALNNVTLLGHCHPRLVDAAARQLSRLNTNSRFVYDVLTEYAAALTATLPDGLDVVYFLNSGSEANDLALRMSRYLSRRDDVVIIDDAYHGYTSVVSDVSPSRYRHYGKPDTTHPTPVPDRYRGEYGYQDPRAGEKYAGHVTETFDRLAAQGRPPAAYLFEGLLAGAGQVVLPPGYLPPIFAAAGQHRIFTIADEVQVGFGRLGERFWGFQTQGDDVVPDFVTMGKSMGNGFPVAALVTTREISEGFDRTGRFFSTYGGNPVACAVGLELLRVLEEEGLQRNALEVGQYLRDRLRDLADKHELIGDVRGQGFYSGVEFVLDRQTKEPARAETLIVCERLKEAGALVYPTGPHWNVLKLKPPLSFTRAHADEFATALDRVLEAGW